MSRECVDKKSAQQSLEDAGERTPGARAAPSRSKQTPSVQETEARPQLTECQRGKDEDVPDEEGQASRVEITQAKCESFCFLLSAVKGYKQGYGNT